MLIARRFLDELEAGHADLAFRRWPRARVRVGTELHTAGPDPRKALAQRSRLSVAELAGIRERLERMDSRSRSGAWTRRTLELIDANPGTRAGDLAANMGMEQRPFKVNVRKLKELGLTHSLEIGYRLSARGRALLSAS